MNRKQLLRIASLLLIIVCALSTSAGGGGDFVTTTVDDRWGVGMYASLALDPTNGFPRISYYDQTHDVLKYAEYSEVLGLPFWSTTNVYDGYLVNTGGTMSAIALDHTSAHLPHMIYRNMDGQVRHAWRECPSGCHWVYEAVDSAVNASGTNIAFAIDSSDVLHVAYYDIISNAMYYRTKVGGVWSPATHLGYGIEPSLAVDSTTGYPAIAYLTTHALMYAYSNGSVWSFDTIYDESGSGKYPHFPSLELNGGDSSQPFISFIDGNSYVRLATFDPMDPTCPGTDGDYACPIIDNLSTFSGFTSLILEESLSANLPRVVYFDEATGELRYTFESTPGVWGSQPVDHSTNVGSSSSLVVDTSGPHIAYYDRDSTSFKFAAIDDSAPGGCGDEGFNAWYKCENLDNAVVGSNDSVAFGYDGFPRIAFYDRSHPGALRFGTLNPLWSSIVIDDSSADIGRYASMALNPASNRMAIAYMDATNSILKYAKELSYGGGNCGPSSFWQCDLIDDIGSGGFGISLTFSNNNEPLISYLDGDAQLIKVARYIGPSTLSTCAHTSDWDCIAIAPGYLTDQGQTSIWADTATSLVMVSWHYSDDTTLMWSQYTMGSGWQTPEIADYAMHSGEQNSLTTIGIMPVIAYSDGRYNDLGLAYRVGGGNGNCGVGLNWYCETLDHAGVTGLSPDIVNNSGRLFISYYDWTNGDLKLTFQAFPPFLPLIKKP